MFCIKQFYFALILLCLSCVCSAQTAGDSIITKPKTLSGFVNLGFSGSRGNVTRSWRNYELEVENKGERNILTLHGQFRDFKNKGEKLDENIDASLFDLVKISGKSWMYGKFSYHRNVYRGFDSQWKVGAGYLYKLVNREKFDFSTRSGYQIRFSEVSGRLEGDYNQGTHHFILLGFKTKVGVVQNVNFKTQCDLELDMERSDNYSVLVKSGFVFGVNKWLDIELNYFYHYAGLPVTGRLALDERLDGSLKIKF